MRKKYRYRSVASLVNKGYNGPVPYGPDTRESYHPTLRGYLEAFGNHTKPQRLYIFEIDYVLHTNIIQRIL